MLAKKSMEYPDTDKLNFHQDGLLMDLINARIIDAPYSNFRLYPYREWRHKKEYGRYWWGFFIRRQIIYFWRDLRFGCFNKTILFCFLWFVIEILRFLIINIDMRKLEEIIL